MNIPSFVLRPICGLLTFSMTALAVPLQPFADAWNESAAKQAKALKDAPKPAMTRALSLAEMRSLKGKTGKNPYAAGSAKYAPQYKGVDLLTGNFSTSATDMSFEGGYGIPVNVTRSYSSNNADEGPLGEGWNLSVDLRSTAGGLLKSPGAPVRMVPVEMQERPRNQTRPGALGPDVPIDANATAAPIEAVIATTASGEEVTLQKDVDGIITPPSWDQNEYENTYENVIRDSGTEVPNVYRVLKTQIVKTPEGTVYNYSKLGKYVYGVTKYDAPALTALSVNTEPSNILKITKATDRHGNETTYTYSIPTWSEPVYLGGSAGQPAGIPQLTSTSQNDYAIFKKSNGYVVEAKLLNIKMQPDREIDFEWGTYGVPYNRISRAKDNGAGGDQRVVKYAYTNGNLTSFKSAEDYETSYTYDAENMISTTTDSRGMVTTFEYDENVRTHLFETARVLSKITAPNGNISDFVYPWQPEANIFNSSDIKFTWILEKPTSGNVPSSAEFCIDFAYRIIPGTSTPAILITKMSDIIDVSISEFGQQVDEYFDISNQNLVLQVTSLSSNTLETYNFGKNRLWKGSDAVDFRRMVQQSSTRYNFFGNPLEKNSSEQKQTNYGTSTRSTSIKYSYWGRDKYYQQKAVWSEDANRYSFTDYFTRNAADGLKGQTRAVYSQGLDSTHNNAPKISNTNLWVLDEGFTQDYVNTIVQADRWRYSHPPLQQESNTNPIAPTNVNPTLPIPSAMFNYDEEGRATEVYKLSKITGGLPSYVKTISEYDATYPTHGVAWKVTEAAGTSSARVTKTLAMDLAGRATLVEDANGRKYQTAYDRDGRTLLVERIYGWDNQETLSETQYGPASPRTVTSGVPVNVTGETMIKNITYGGPWSGGAYGQPTGVFSVGDVEYWNNYKYDALGNRTELRVSPASGEEQIYRYSDYIAVGSPLQQSYAYQTMTRMTLSGGQVKFSPEEFHYLYDSSGRILETAFAQTPNAGYANLDGGSLNNNSSWYDDQNGDIKLAQSRARTVYNYDEGGRLATLETFWDTLNGTTYNSASIRKAAYTYEKTGLNRGLKTSYKLYHNGSNIPAVNESYAYDPNLDYLTSASYLDQPSGNGSWTYDASGNRANAGYAYDALNRMISAPGKIYAHDAVGNRTVTFQNSGPNGGPPYLQEATYTWNSQNQLTGVQLNGSANNSVSFAYQPDGLRYMKVVDNNTAILEDDSSFVDDNNFRNDPTTTYYYDGQMGIAEHYMYTYQNGYAEDFTQNVIGPRGIEMQRIKVRTTPWDEQYPLYDGHGNMISNLKITRPPLVNGMYSGNTTSSTSGDRKYDVWGAVRGGNTTGYPNNRYCANLGHVVDDELGLIYMRARYYEPGTGRFISEDPAGDGWNWYSYCRNTPTEFVDSDGKVATALGKLATGAVVWSLSSTMNWLFEQLEARGIPVPDGAEALAKILNCAGEVVGLVGTGQLLMSAAQATAKFASGAYLVSPYMSVGLFALSAGMGVGALLSYTRAAIAIYQLVLDLYLLASNGD